MNPDELIDAAGLTFACSPVASNPFMPQDSSDMRHYLCAVSGEGVPSFEFYVSLGEDVAGEPDFRSALSLVVEDVRAYRECDGYGDFARLLGIDEDDPSGLPGWEELSRIAPSVEAVADRGNAPAVSF